MPICIWEGSKKVVTENLGAKKSTCLEVSKKSKVWIIFSAIAGITIFHYSIGINHFIHQVYGEFYFAPILLSALWFGFKGGLFASILIDILLLPHFFIAWGSNTLGLWSVLLEAPALNLAGLVIGYLSDKEREGKRAEEKVKHLVSLEKNYSFAAHEMKNIGIVIHGFAKRLNKKTNLSGEATQFLGVIEEESLRMEKLAKGMLNFFHTPILKKEKLDLNEFLRGVILLVEETVREKGIEFHSEVQKGLPSIWLDSDRIKEVLVNLVYNAVYSTPPGGKIILKVHENSRHIKIQIVDSGLGIPREHLPKVFLPFFTTKPNGDGLGLAISKKIIEAHGAMIEVDSQEGKGTQFTALFPIEEID